MGTRLASDVGGGKKTFDGLWDCLKKTATGPGGFMALYSGFGVSLMGIIPYRGFQLGAFDTIVGLNPYKMTRASWTRCPLSVQLKQPSLWGLVSVTSLTLSAEGCRCKLRSLLRSMFMEVLWIV